MNGSKLCCLMAAGFWLSVAIPGANAAILNPVTLYEANFPSPGDVLHADCSPCEDHIRGVYGRVFDQIRFPHIEVLGRPVTLTSIEFAIWDRTPLSDGRCCGAADDINLSIFDGLGVLFSETQSNSEWVKKDVIDSEQYTVSFLLPNVVISSEIVYISPFGVNGTTFGLQRYGGSGGNVAFWSESTEASGFVGRDNTHDYAIRVNGVVGDVTAVPLPASFLMLIAGLAALGVMRRRKEHAIPSC